MSVSIRPATSRDASLSQSSPPEHLHHLVAVETDDGTVIGEIFVLDAQSGKQMRLEALYVVPEARRKGAGMALVREADRIAKSYGNTAVANVAADAPDAVHLFRRAGWAQNGIEWSSADALAESKKTWRVETTAVHAGIDDGELGPVTPQIQLSTTYRVSHPGTYGRWAYARSANPTRNSLEEALAALEGGAGAGAFSSGLAAIDAALRFLDPGQRIVVSNDVYGGTWRLLNSIWQNIGLEVEPVDLTDLDAARKALDGAHMLIVETPSNPLLRILDIQALADMAHANGALFVVDNTFATPHLQRPLDFGADMVVHSTTKCLGGHSDAIGGALVAKTQEHVDRIKYLQRAAGAVQGPFDSYMILRGIRTMSVRLDRYCSNARTVAEMLREHPKVSHVYYPGFEDDPGYELAQKQMRQAGGLVSFLHKDGQKAANRMVQRVKLFTLAESLGAVESLIEVPAAMTHAISSGSLLEVPNNLVRVSCGIEHIDDLLDDLRQALDG